MWKVFPLMLLFLLPLPHFPLFVMCTDGNATEPHNYLPTATNHSRMSSQKRRLPPCLYCYPCYRRSTGYCVLPAFLSRVHFQFSLVYFFSVFRTFRIELSFFLPFFCLSCTVLGFSFAIRAASFIKFDHYSVLFLSPSSLRTCPSP